MVDVENGDRCGLAAAQALFDRLADGGTVTMPYGPTFFAGGFGMCTDRFGTSWMVSHGMAEC